MYYLRYITLRYVGEIQKVITSESKLLKTFELTYFLSTRLVYHHLIYQSFSKYNALHVHQYCA